MPINLNLWSLMLGRWLNTDQGQRDLTTVPRQGAPRDKGGGAGRWRDRPPPMNLARLSPHLRRDIGLDIDRL